MASEPISHPNPQLLTPENVALAAAVLAELAGEPDALNNVAYRPLRQAAAPFVTLQADKVIQI